MVYTLAELKTWARIDGTDLDAAATLALTAAEEYVASTTGVTLTAEDMPLAKAACFGLASHWIENPEPVVVGVTPAEIPFGVRTILAQMAEEI